jgi:hypothetical protein
MGTVPQDTDVVAEVLNRFLKAIATGGATAAEIYVKSLAPGVLTLPIISQLLDFGISEITNVLYGFLANSITAIVIDIQTSGEKSGVVNASTALTLAQASGDINAIQTATNNLVQAWGNLIHWDGSANS